MIKGQKIRKKPDLNTKIGQYFIARHRHPGKSKKEAAEIVGYPPQVVTRVENTATYQALERKYFKDELAKRISSGEIAEALIDNIRQDSEEKVDRNARNKAIEIAVNRLEPEKGANEENERVYVVIR